MSPGQARPLLVLPTVELQVEAATQIITNSLTARDAEELSRKLNQRGSVKPKKKLPKQSVDEQSVVARLGELLGTRVRITSRGWWGRV